VTELCTGGELFDKIQDETSFSENKAAEIMKQVLSAVFYCHSEKIVHR
jgi:calcium-dependent protein kinase